MARTNPTQPQPDEIEAGTDFTEQSLESQLAKYDWESGDYALQVFRMAPNDYQGKVVGGFIHKTNSPMTLDELAAKFGGQKYRLTIAGPNGKWIKIINDIRIAGDPIISVYDINYGSFHKDSAKSNGNTTVIREAAEVAKHDPLVDKLFSREFDRSDALERQTRQIQEKLMQAQRTPEPDNHALNVIRESSRESLTAHREALHAANERSLAAEERMSALMQTLLTSKNDRSDTEVYNTLIGAMRDEGRQAREEHGRQLIAAQEQARDQIRQSAEQSRLLFDGVKSQYESQLATVRDSNASQSRATEDQLRMVREELTKERDQTSRLRDELATARHAALEAKIGSQNELGNLSNIESSLTKVKGLMGLLGGGDKAEAPVTTLDKTLSFLAGGTPERIISTLAARFKGQTVEPATPQAATEAVTAWSSWREAMNPAPPPPLPIVANPVSTDAAGEPIAIASTQPEDSMEPLPSEEMGLMRVLAKRIEDNAGVTPKEQFAELLVQEAEKMGFADVIRTVSYTDLLSTFKRAGIDLSFTARIYTREVLDVLKNSSPS